MERERRAASNWFGSSMYRSVMAAFGGTIPPYLDFASPSTAVYAHHQHWQALIYGVLIRGRIGSSIDVQECLDILTQRGIGFSPKAVHAVDAWLLNLEREHHLRRQPDGSHWKITEPVTER